MEIKILHEGEDYTMIKIGEHELEVSKHDGKVIRHLLKAIASIRNAYL